MPNIHLKKKENDSIDFSLLEQRKKKHSGFYLFIISSARRRHRLLLLVIPFLVGGFSLLTVLLGNSCFITYRHMYSFCFDPGAANFFVFDRT